MQGVEVRMIHKKWKLLAFGQYFQNDLGVDEALKLFDELSAARTPFDYAELLKPTRVTLTRLWPEYAVLPIERVVDDMYALAEHAQDVENMEV
jgi:hypothetical protein